MHKNSSIFMFDIDKVHALNTRVTSKYMDTKTSNHMNSTAQYFPIINVLSNEEIH